MKEDKKLPFDLTATPKGTQSLIVKASMDGKPITNGRLTLGSIKSRQELAEVFANDARLRNGSLIEAKDIVLALETLELSDQHKKSEDETPTVECASHVDSRYIVELAWDEENETPDFIIFNRETKAIVRSDDVQLQGKRLVPPRSWLGIVTFGGKVPGTVFVPTHADEIGDDEDRLRTDVLTFIERYVELPGDAARIAAEFVFLSWVYDGFDELPYLAFRTADAGRGKSRALETVGILCYRPILAGGGSTAAATLRLIDLYNGSLVCDEFDSRRDSELTSQIAKIVNQGFQKNRPIIKCIGEGNEPKPFRCFGPKVFALRQSLGDDASESRTLSVYMQQRTRKDIPLNLPRAKFDAGSLALRNRLLWWRFTRLGTFSIDATHADERLEDRANQIGLPLMAVAGDAGRGRIVEALLQQQGTLQETRGDTLAGELFGVILDTVETNGVVRPGAIAIEANRRRARDMGFERDGEPDVSRLKGALTAQKVGWTIKGELELVRDRDNVGTCYKLTEARGRELCHRFGMGTERLPPLQNCNGRENRNRLNRADDTENADRGDGGNSGNVPDSGRRIEKLESENATKVVPDGWAPERWADRLEELADKCESVNPDKAAEHRKTAAEIRAKLGDTT